MNGERLMIGICGGTGSGKTTLARRISEELGEDALLLSMDSYYKDNRDKPFEERVKVNYDHPDAFDMELLTKHLSDLKEGKAIDCPTYDFTVHARNDEIVRLESRRVIIIEGILLFACPELAKLLDIKIYVDTDADVRIIRRLVRDVKKRGRSLDSVVEQYLTTVKPMHDEFIEPSKRIADVIVPEGGYNAVAYDMILSTILKRLGK